MLILFSSLYCAVVFGLSAACERGSHLSCKKSFGDGFCCAYVDIKSDKDQLKGYWCADRKYAGEDYDYAGYSGKIICSSGKVLMQGGMIALALISFLLIC